MILWSFEETINDSNHKKIDNEHKIMLGIHHLLPFSYVIKLFILIAAST